MRSFAPSPNARSCVGLASLLLAIGCEPAPDPSPAPAAASAPSFLVIDIDSMRYDRLDESRRADTPALHSLVDRGVVFDAAYSSSGWTAPSLATLLLGAFPTMERRRAGGMHAWSPSIAGGTTLPEVLGYYGYDTAAFWGGEGDGLLAGSSAIFGSSQGMMFEGSTSYDRGVTAWLEARTDTPFFAFVHNLDLHRPGPPRLQALPGEQAQPEPACVQELFGPLARQKRENQTSDENVQYQIERYDCALICYDRSIARIMATLEATGLDERTVVVLTSNHGELLREHDTYGHELLYDPVLHIPFVVVDPGGPGPRRETAVVELQDLAPTMLAWAGATVPREMDGRDLRPLLRQTGQVEPPAALYALTNRGNASIQRGDHKLIRADDSLRNGPTMFRWAEDQPIGSWHELYDLAADPGELTDLTAEQPALVDELDVLLGAWIEPRYSEGPGDPQAMDADLERALKERGYWDAVTEPGAGRKPPPPGAGKKPPPPGDGKKPPPHGPGRKPPPPPQQD